MKVLVTGSSSHLAAALLPKLCARGDVAAVTGIDLLPPHYEHPKFHATQCDIRSAEAARLLEGRDALVHLAFVVLRGRMALRHMRDINVHGSHALCLAASRAGVKRIVHVSSAAAYGNGTQLTEDAPLQPVRGFAYAEHKARLEELLARDVPQCVRLRPHVILGRHAQRLLQQLLHQPCYLRLPEPYPRLQCVHEDDVAQAVAQSLVRDARGAYNLAAAGDFSFRDVIRRSHRIGVPLPVPLARAALSFAWRLTGWGGEPAWIDGLAATLTLNCTRARHDLGWQPVHDAAAMLFPGVRPSSPGTLEA